MTTADQDQRDGAEVLTVTVQDLQQDRDSVNRLAEKGPVAVMHEGRAVAFLGVDSTPTFEVAERDEDQYSDNGVARGDAAKALFASVNTSYWAD